MDPLIKRIGQFVETDTQYFQDISGLPHTLRRVKSDDFLRIIAKSPQLATSFWWAAIQEEAILREQIIRVGRRSARERVGHLILELNRRISAVTGELENYLYLPVPQALASMPELPSAS